MGNIFIACDTKWGEDGPFFTKVCEKLKLAIIHPDKACPKLKDAKKGTYILLKKGQKGICLGELIEIQHDKTWQDIIIMLEEENIKVDDKLSDKALEHIIYVKVNEWIGIEEIVRDTCRLASHEIQSEDLKKTLEKILQQHEQKKMQNTILDLLKIQKNVVLTGAPGTGKTFLAKEVAKNITKDKVDNIAFVQFHPSYDYTDFVEGLRPVMNSDGSIGFELKNGIFKELCTKAQNESEETFVIIIDEINRAELSKVFGELFFSIEPSYRGDSGKVSLQYSNLYLKDGTDVFENGFYIPENVYIIATMNNIDRSIEPFDFAMKRRFAWHEILAEKTAKDILSNAIVDDSIKDTTLKKMKKLNEEIEKIFSTDYQLGGAYFAHIEQLKYDFDKLWIYHIKPVLEDYLKGHTNEEALLGDFKKCYVEHSGDNDASNT